MISLGELSRSGGALLRRAGETALSLLYAPHCAHCKADTPSGCHLCETCSRSARRLIAPFCQICSEPFSGEITAAFSCMNCGDRHFHFTGVVAPYRSRGVVRDFIHRFKYDGHFYLRHPLAAWMAAGFDDARLASPAIDALVPVPLHAARRREREFNQAEVLATLAGAARQIPVLRDLQRIRYTTTQTRLNREERMENLRGAFRIRNNTRVQGRHLVLIDDVMTTGSTVEECARVLRQAGAASVRVLTVARA
jgi:competence protein ComFC